MAMVTGAVAVAAVVAVLLFSYLSRRSLGGARATTAALRAQCRPAAFSPEECAVCLSEIAGEAAAARTLPRCGHGFHEECIGRWLPLRGDCPLCRCSVLADGPDAARAAAFCPAAAAAAATPWARPPEMKCGFGEGRVVWTRSPPPV